MSVGETDSDRTGIDGNVVEWTDVGRRDIYAKTTDEGKTLTQGKTLHQPLDNEIE